MEEILYLNKENVQGMKLIGYKEMNIKGECGCALCGKGLKHIYIISNGTEFAHVGSECVQTIAVMQGKNTMDGITKIPKNKRSSIKRYKKDYEQEFNEETEDLPF